MTPNIIVLDTETTGIDNVKDRLVELAAVDARDLSRQFTTLVNPGIPIPPSASGVHHLVAADVENAVSEKEAVANMKKSLLDPAERTIYVAHNAKFDRGFLSRIDPVFDAYWICTYKCAMMLIPECPDFKNQTIRYYLGLKPNVPADLFPHRALYDTIVTAEIFNHLMTMTSLKQMIEWSNNPIVLPRVSFGKHAGMTWDKVPYGYLKWVVGQKDMDEDVIHTANYWLRRG